MPLTILITGGSGYLGQFLVEEFAKTERVRQPLLFRIVRYSSLMFGSQSTICQMLPA